MPNEYPFIAAIREAPDDDVPRLIFADWLDERGEAERAELIRVQCQLARLPIADSSYPELRLRALELIAEHESEWLGKWAERLVRWEFDRGLLHAITTRSEPFITHGMELFAEHPVERVAVVSNIGETLTSAEEIDHVVAAPAMAYVVALEAGNGRRSDPRIDMYAALPNTSVWLSSLASAKHARRLRELDLNGYSRVGPGGIEFGDWEEFCQAGHLRGLRRLDLSGCEIFAPWTEFAQVLAKATFAGELRKFYLDMDIETAEALEKLENLDFVLQGNALKAVLVSPRLANLRSLHISSTETGGWQQLLASSRFQKLDALSISGETISEEAVLALQHAQLDQLTSLSLLSRGWHREFPEQAIAAMLQSRWAVKLQSLHLSGARRMNARCLAPFFARPVDKATQLRSLSLPNCDGVGEALADWPGLARLTDLAIMEYLGEERETDIAALSQSPYLSCRLARLDLSGCCRSLDAVRLFANSSGLAGLQSLRFEWNTLNVEKMKLLLQSPSLRQLECLHLSSEDDDEALALLAKPSAWPRLRNVVVGSGCSPEVIAALTQRFGPRLRVFADC